MLILKAIRHAVITREIHPYEHSFVSAHMMESQLANEKKISNSPETLRIYTALFISPSRISELDCATTKTDTAERSISIGTESLQLFLFCTRGLGVLAGSTARV